MAIQSTSIQFGSESTLTVTRVCNSRCPRASNPTSFIKNRSDPTGFLSDSFRSESGPDFIVFRRIPIKSGPDSNRKKSDKIPVGSDRNYSDPTGSDPPSLTWVCTKQKQNVQNICYFRCTRCFTRCS
jgi:hypothetical protein